MSRPSQAYEGPNEKALNLNTELRAFPIGRDDWIRTSDLTHPKRARYQAAPRPVICFKYVCKRRFVKPRKSDSSLGRLLLRQTRLPGFRLKHSQQLLQLGRDSFQGCALYCGSVTRAFRMA